MIVKVQTSKETIGIFDIVGNAVVLSSAEEEKNNIIFVVVSRGDMLVQIKRKPEEICIDSSGDLWIGHYSDKTQTLWNDDLSNQLDTPISNSENNNS